MTVPTKPSRFQRAPQKSENSPIAPGPAAPSSTTLTPTVNTSSTGHLTHAGHNAAQAALSGPELQALQQRLTRAKERRMRREIERDRAINEAAQLQKEAEAQFGVRSLEELEAYVAKATEEDEKALQQLMIDLQKEEELLDRIDRALTQLDQQSSV